VVHHGQCLPFLGKPRDDRAAVHAALDDFQRHVTAHGFPLPGEPDRAKATFAEARDQLVAVDHVASGLFLGLRRLCSSQRASAGEGGAPGIGCEQGQNPLPKGGVDATSRVEVTNPILGRPLERGEKDHLGVQ
jgi:hypothetical protein